MDSAPPRTLWRGSPYPGLRAFTEAETAIFFGRDREADELLSRLRYPACRFLAIIADSGTGKSSLLQASLLPRLRAGALPGSKDWRFATFTPARQMGDPILSLSTALRDALPPAMRPAARARSSGLANDEASFRRSVAQVLAGASHTAELILVVDQFEELFALECQGPFIELLGRAAATPRVRILATMRADFYPQAARNDTLAALLRAGSFPLAAPKHSALRDMIRRPAERAGALLPSELVDALLDDAGGDPGALPLIAFALAELWPEGTAPELTLAAYERIGRLRGAIGRRAAALGLDDAAEPALGRLFAALVQVSADGIATRRRAARSQLSDPDVASLVDALVEERFLLAGGEPSFPTVELAHEALLAGWPALQAWLGRRGPHLRARREVVDALARWHQKDESDQELLPPGSRLHEAEELLHQAPDLLDDAGLRTFIERSLDRAARIDREAQGTLRREALRLAQLADEQIKAGDAVASVLLGLEAVDRVHLVRDEPPLALAVTGLYESTLAQKELRVLHGHEHLLFSAVFSPDGTRVLTASSDHTARLWNATSGQQLQVLRGHEDVVSSAMFSPDGARVLTASDDGTARLWDATSGQQLQVLRGHEGSVSSAVFSPDGTRVLTASGDFLGRDNIARLWDAGQELLALRGHESWVSSAVFSPDGARVLTASSDDTARLWPIFASVDALIATVRSRLPRGLSPDQRRRFYLPET